MSQTLRQYADDLAANLFAGQPRLHAKQLELQAQLEDVKAQLSLAQTAIDRANAFVAHRDGVHQCPRCWVEQEVSAHLSPLPNDDGDDDLWRCDNCRSEFVTPS